MAYASITAHRQFLFKVDPYDISWGYSLRTQTTDTYGGRVVQILGVELSTLTINTVAGKAGYPYLEEMRSFFREMGLWQQSEQKPAVFSFPPKNYNLSFWGERFSYDHAIDNVVFPVQITGMIQEDIAGTLKQSIMTAELKKLAEGIGYTRNGFNDPAIGALNKAEYEQLQKTQTADPATGQGTSGSTNVVVPSGGLAATHLDSQNPSQWGWNSGSSGVMVPFSWQGHSFGSVASGTEKLWTALLNELVPNIPGGLIDGHLFGYSDRNNVNNPSSKSFHAYGLALDVNSSENYNGASGYGRSGKGVIPGEVAHALAAKYGMLWGGDFNGTTDPMHFEIHVRPEEIAAWAAGS